MSSLYLPGDTGYGIGTKQDEKLLEVLGIKRGVEGFWQSVDMFLDHLRHHRNPEMRNAMKKLLADCKSERETKKNKWASAEDKSIRKVGVIPDKLYLFLERLYEHDLPMSEEQFTKGFFKRYPEFMITDKL